MRCKIYLSDEGFGHIVRQRAVVEELRRLDPSLHMTVQTSRHLETAKRFIPGIETIDRYNNITWHKKENGSPDIEKIREAFSGYAEQSDQFISQEESEFDFDFCISDIVSEAFEVAVRKNKPAFGIAHFTWDWFFSKLYPPPLSTDVLFRMMSQHEKATQLFFPPFTPQEILHHYRKNAVEVPLILRTEIDHKVTSNEGRFKVLIVDSGAGVIGQSIIKALHSVKDLNDMLFFVSEKFRSDQPNVSYIPADDLMVDYVNDMDLVIGRAGFNTISECIGLRTPMLLLGEAMNPEINENIMMLKQQHLASFISLSTFENDLGKFLPSFLMHEYKFIRQSMVEHTIATNGAEVIASSILERIN
ncbi:MAG: glycosyltransferase [Flavobacteriales bacterium]|nr:glycosyltransferase [Flavobacteriales bacterium]